MILSHNAKNIKVINWLKIIRYIKCLTIIVLIFYLMVNSLSAQSLRDLLMEGHDLQELAEQGDARAQATMGSMKYHEGNYNEAFKWFLKSADQGDVISQKYLGLMYYEGNGISQDYEQAYTWFMKSAKQGNYLSQYWIAEMYFYVRGIPQNYVQSHKWFNLAASKGHLEEAIRNRDFLEQRMTPEQVAEA